MVFAPAEPADLATISFASLISEDPSIRAAEIDRLQHACENIGFFYLADHGVDSTLVQRIFKSARNFFMLPEDVKQQWGQHAQIFTPRQIRGYSTGVEKLNPGVDKDNKQLFELGAERPLVPGKPFTGPNVLPPDDVAPDFAKAQTEILHHVMRVIVPGLAKALALSLGLDESFFVDKVTEKGMLLTQRVLYYPPRKGACGRHTDSGLFTLILQETQVGSSSFKLFTKGQWRDVKAKEDVFVVNLANILMYWTNGRYVSTPHQVVHQGDKSRISVPFFVYPDATTVVAPIGRPDAKKLVVGEVYLNDLKDIWDKQNGAGAWAKECSKNKSCGCWRCM